MTTSVASAAWAVADGSVTATPEASVSVAATSAAEPAERLRRDGRRCISYPPRDRPAAISRPPGHPRTCRPGEAHVRVRTTSPIRGLMAALAEDCASGGPAP